MDIFAQIAERIILAQEKIIGPIALEQAQGVPGLKVDLGRHEIEFIGNKTDIIEQLIEKYREIFGQASVEVCKEAAKNILSGVSEENIPLLLR
jgi:hypothetical protein